MSPGEVAFLVMVIVSISVFAIAIAYASFVASGESTTSPARHTPKQHDRSRGTSATISHPSKVELPVASIR